MSALQSKARLRMLNGPGHLYAAYSRYCDWIKIGFTQPLSEGGDGIGHQYLDVVQPNIAASEKSCGGVESRHAGQGAGRLEGLGVQPGVKGAGASVSGAQAQEREALSQSHKAASVHSTDSSDQAGVAPGPQEPDWDAIVASQPPQLRRVPA